MMKEIHEQPRALYDTLMTRVREGRLDLSEIHITDEFMRDIDEILIVACGSAYHAGILGKYVIEKLARVPVSVDAASEFRYRSPILKPSQLVVVISQSGETADTIAALREAKRHGVKVVAITNVKGSSISREADATMYTQAGLEIAVATSKGYSTQVMCLYMMALELGRIHGTLTAEEYDALLGELKRLPELAAKILEDETAVQHLASQRYMDEHEFFIGRGHGLCAHARGFAQAKGALVYPFRGVSFGRAQARADCAHRAGHAGNGAGDAGAAHGKILSNFKEVKAQGSVCCSGGAGAP